MEQILVCHEFFSGCVCHHGDRTTHGLPRLVPGYLRDPNLYSIFPTCTVGSVAVAVAFVFLIAFGCCAASAASGEVVTVYKGVAGGVEFLRRTPDDVLSESY